MINPLKILKSDPIFKNYPSKQLHILYILFYLVISPIKYAINNKKTSKIKNET